MSVTKKQHQATFQLRVRSKNKESLSQREIQTLISKALYEKGYDFLLWEDQANKKATMKG